ncbi:glycosyltransferase [Pluralibacter gergoviae]
MINILYVSMLLEKNNYGGSVVSRTNLKALKANDSLNIKEVAILKSLEGKYTYELLSSRSKFETAINNMRGYAGRLNPQRMRKIKNIIHDFKPAIVYLDSSMLGGIAYWCKKKYPDIKIITFFHNIELDFECDRFRSGKFQFLPSLYSSILNERKAAKHSDVIVTLHKSDSERLYKLYHRHADYCIPVCVDEESGTEARLQSITRNNKFRIAFFGTAFFANIQAAQYISNKIAPHFLDNNDVEFIIAGNGFDNYKTELESSNVSVTGYIEDLGVFYNDIDLILSPISAGAGMKVKIAEALKYNKKIIASEFSLIGYEQIKDCADVISCLNLNDYISAITDSLNALNNSCTTHELYKEYYSSTACINYFRKVIAHFDNQA